MYVRQNKSAIGTFRSFRHNLTAFGAVLVRTGTPRTAEPRLVDFDRAVHRTSWAIDLHSISPIGRLRYALVLVILTTVVILLSPVAQAGRGTVEWIAHSRSSLANIRSRLMPLDKVAIPAGSLKVLNARMRRYFLLVSWYPRPAASWASFYRHQTPSLISFISYLFITSF